MYSMDPSLKGVSLSTDSDHELFPSFSVSALLNEKNRPAQSKINDLSTLFGRKLLQFFFHKLLSEGSRLNVLEKTLEMVQDILEIIN